MKKFAGLLIIFFLFTASADIYAAEMDVTREGRSDLSALQRSKVVLVRGIVNVVTSPLEVIRTAKLEPALHPKGWPISVIPMAAYHAIIRVSSGAYDMTIFPIFVVPFSDDIRPFTHFYDLPDYPWQTELNEE